SGSAFNRIASAQSQTVGVASAASDLLFVEEDFNYEPGPLYDENRTPSKAINGGTGWASPWIIGNGTYPPTYPAFKVDKAQAFNYPDLLESSQYMSGGESYGSIGRTMLASGASLPAAYLPYVSDSKFGVAGNEIWVSVLMKTNNLSQPCEVSIHPSNIAAWPGSAPNFITVGQLDATKKWGIKYNNVIQYSTVDVKMGEAALFLLRYQFHQNRGAVISMYVNPDIKAALPTPAVQFDTGTNDISFKAIRFNPASIPGAAAFDAFRVGSTCEAVLPLKTMNQPVTKAILHPVQKDATTLAGGALVGSNESPTNGFQIIITIAENVSGEVVTLEIPQNTKAYRYVKYYGKSGSSAKVADMEFYSNARRLSGTPFGTIATPGNEAEKAFDGDISTYFEGQITDDQYVGLDFGGETIVAKPSSSAVQGRYEAPFVVTLSCETELAEIYYTKDGSVPSKENGILYTVPIPIGQGESVLLKAVAFKAGLFESEMFVAGYGVGIPAPIAQGLRTYSLGNSLTDTLVSWLVPVAQSVGYSHSFLRLTIPGAPVSWLYTHQTTGNGTPWVESASCTTSTTFGAPYT
ncbi:MAG: FN3 associated domain-containing protein, partial [Clostridia bacterium]